MNQIAKIICKAGIVAGAACITAPSIADVSAMIGITNDYVDRGISQSNNGAAPAVSGGIDYFDNQNWYVGLFVSSSEFTNQVDSYLGFEYSWHKGQFIDVGVIGTWYPQQNDDLPSEDTFEIYIGGGSDIATGRWDIYLSYDPDFETLYPEINLSWPVGVGALKNVNITAHVGYLSVFSDDERDMDSVSITEVNAASPNIEYVDYSIGLEKDGWQLLVSDTDIQDDDPRVIVRKRWNWPL